MKKNVKKTYKKNFIFKLIQSLDKFFPDLFIKLKEIDDPRLFCEYGIDEIVFAAIMISIFKAGSRNGFNNMNQNKFAENYYRAFKMTLPHMDTVAHVLEKLENKELEELQRHLVKSLIEKKIFYKYKIFGNFYNVSVDGRG